MVCRWKTAEGFVLGVRLPTYTYNRLLMKSALSGKSKSVFARQLIERGLFVNFRENEGC